MANCKAIEAQGATLEPRHIINEEAARLHISNGNGKTGRIFTVNLLPGDEANAYRSGQPVSNIPGSCGGVCECCKGECYAMRSMFAYLSACRAWAENSALLATSPGSFYSALVEELEKLQRKADAGKMPPVVRIHSAGEFPNAQAVTLWNEAAKAFPGLRFYAYTKRTDAVERAFSSVEKADNFVVQISQWRDAVKVPSALEAFPVFEYDDGSPDLETVPHCPAVLKPERPGAKGKPNYIIQADGTKRRYTCADCGFRCAYRKPYEHTAVYAH